jgi:hypothetical protein
VAVLTVDPKFTRVVLVAERNRLHESGRIFIERSRMGKTGIATRPRGVEFLRDLDFQIGIFFLEHPEFVRLADAAGDEGICARGRGE